MMTMNTHCCCKPLSDNPAACGCCEGTELLTPLATLNRPGLAALSYRIGTHAAFLESMQARLSNLCLDEETDCRQGKGRFPLRQLTTRRADDFSIALLDAWATIGDVLTFYQERIANEGYLRTATERRSVLELARLVGYALRPGVSSSVYLAYTIDPKHTAETIILAGSRAQSVPGQGELPQSFETSEELKARAIWNDLKPRLARPQTEKSIRQGNGDCAHVYLKGTTTNLKPNDPLLIDFTGDENKLPEFFRVKEVIPDAAANRTRVVLLESVVNNVGKAIQSVTADHVQTVLQPSANVSETGTSASGNAPFNFIQKLALSPSIHPASSRKLNLNLDTLFFSNTAGGNSSLLSDDLRQSLAASEVSHAVLGAFMTAQRDKLGAAVSHAQVTLPNPVKVYALRVKASLFGHNAPKEPRYQPAATKGPLFSCRNPNAGSLLPQQYWPEWTLASDENPNNYLFLDTEYQSIVPNSFIAVQFPTNSESTEYKVETFRIADVVTRSRNAYGLSMPTTVIELPKGKSWWEFKSQQGTNDFTRLIRGTRVYAESELLELAEEPNEDPVCDGADELIELDGFYEGLESGRWVIVSGEREIEGTNGVRFSELAMLSGVSHGLVPPGKEEEAHEGDKALDGDRMHTFIRLATDLAYRFKRDTVTIHGNVVKATHGETRSEVLGSGDGSQPLQRFELKQPPLTFVPASNPSGVESTLQVYVNDVRWHESAMLAGLGKNDRRFMTRTDDAGKTSVIFGNGNEGARLPTGIENVRAVYRNGIGKSGNVKAEQISLLSSKPLGVKAVVNPLPASGGADRETRDQARKNVPLGVKALDRLVSVQDYEDFTRVFAGIGKARAVEISDGRRRIVHLTIAGIDDIPIETHSDLYRNLTEALRRQGDADQPFRIELRELKLLVLSANVRIHPDFLWEEVEPRIRARLLDVFSFERREPGRDALLSEAIAAMQSVRGVTYVDVDSFGGIPEKQAGEDGVRRLLTPKEITDAVREIVEESRTSGPASRVGANLASYEKEVLRPAQLAYLTPLVPDTLILNEVPR